MSPNSYVYGPVPSRRLGISLGLNIIPAKTCTLNCIYCQCGRTTKITINRRSFFPVKEILNQVTNVANQYQKIDFLTFSGEGEPTLNKDIGKLIRALKRRFPIPVAVITNSTLLYQPRVRHVLYSADLVVPTLDAADQETFERVNRPFPGLKIEKVIQGLKIFSRYYRGKIWLEIMLVKGINDSPEHLMKLRRLTEELKPDRVHLNTVVRPPAEKTACALSLDDLQQIKMLFPDAEIPSPIMKKSRSRFRATSYNDILALVRNRPVTTGEISVSLGIPPVQVQKHLSHLVCKGLVKKVRFSDKTFYEPT